MGIGLTMQTLGGWQSQYARMVRWHDRVIAVANGSRLPDELDFLVAFFEAAFQMRDWLGRSNAVAQADLERLFSVHVEVMLCRDIANGFKHYSLTKPSIDREFAVVNQYVPKNWPSRHAHQVGLVALAQKVLVVWQSFLANRGLIQ